MATDRIALVCPIPEACRADAVRLYWQAFGAKLGRVMAPEDKALGCLARVMDLRFGIGALGPKDRLMGLAGFKTTQGSLAGGGVQDLAAVYGRFGAFWRGALLSLLERPLDADTLLMDGIVVDAEARGQGLGTCLLDAIKSRAKADGNSCVRLDVIDSNPRARALYERQGFAATGTQSLGPFAPLFGFRSATTMTFRIAEAGQATRDAFQPPGNTGHSKGVQ